MKEDKTIKSDAATHRPHFVQNGIEAFRSFSRKLLERVFILKRLLPASACT
jgi:hypothetical protein